MLLVVVGVLVLLFQRAEGRGVPPARRRRHGHLRRGRVDGVPALLPRRRPADPAAATRSASSGASSSPSSRRASSPTRARGSARRTGPSRRCRSPRRRPSPPSGAGARRARTTSARCRASSPSTRPKPTACASRLGGMVRKMTTLIGVAVLLPGAAAIAKTSHEGWPKINGDLKMHKSDQSGSLVATKRTKHNELLGGHGNDTICAGPHRRRAVGRLQALAASPSRRSTASTAARARTSSTPATARTSSTAAAARTRSTPTSATAGSGARRARRPSSSATSRRSATSCTAARGSPTRPSATRRPGPTVNGCRARPDTPDRTCAGRSSLD